MNRTVGTTLVCAIIGAVLVAVAMFLWSAFKRKQQKAKNYERALKLIPMHIHLPPSSDDITGNGRDERDITDEALSEAEVMYSILSSTLMKGWRTKMFGQRPISFEIIAKDGLIKYFVMVPVTLREEVKQAINAAYPTAKVEEAEEINIFPEGMGAESVAGGELSLKKNFIYPINTFKETKRDASLAILNAMSAVKKSEGMTLQMIIRPTDGSWTRSSASETEKIREGKSRSGSGAQKILDFITDAAFAFWRSPEEHKYENSEEKKPLSNLQQEEIQAIEEKTKHPGFETMIRVVAATSSKQRSEAILTNLIGAFAQFASANYNSFQYDFSKDAKKLVNDYLLRLFPQNKRSTILNSVELASIFHLPSQNAIPTSQVERQMMKQVDGPAVLVEDGILLGVNEFRGVKKEIRLSVDDRRRHTYVIGSTGMGKSVFLRNIAYQDMMDGRGFAFLDPHGDVAEELLEMVPPERIDDVIYFNPADLENPIGMNMFEYQIEDQKDFIVQEGINMLQSLFDPGNQGFFGPRGQHMFRNAALLLMSDPKGATFIDIPQCFTDPQFVKDKLKYVTDRNVYDYWTKEFPASQKSNEAGDVVSWFNSKWGPFISSPMMRNVMGQIHSGFDLREIMDNHKILLVNLSKGAMGEVNSKLLGMIFVMKFQAAAMSRVDMPEDQREDFCLFVDEFQNFATESFESILSEARKFRLNLVVANQFMTQLTDKIREAIIGNVGTVVSGRLGVTDAELMAKVFQPTFTVEDLTKTPNHYAVSRVMMHGMQSSPFTMTWPMLQGEGGPEVREGLIQLSAAKYGRPRKEVEKEIEERRKTQTEKQGVSNGKIAGAGGALGDSGGGAAKSMASSKPVSRATAVKGAAEEAILATRKALANKKPPQKMPSEAPKTAQKAPEATKQATDASYFKVR